MTLLRIKKIFLIIQDSKLELDQHIESCKTEIIKIQPHSLINSLPQFQE